MNKDIDDLAVISGQREQLLGKIQERHGIAKDEAEKQLQSWEQENRYDWR